MKSHDCDGDMMNCPCTVAMPRPPITILQLDVLIEHVTTPDDDDIPF